MLDYSISRSLFCGLFALVFGFVFTCPPVSQGAESTKQRKAAVVKAAPQSTAQKQAKTQKKQAKTQPTAKVKATATATGKATGKATSKKIAKTTVKQKNQHEKTVAKKKIGKTRSIASTGKGRQANKQPVRPPAQIYGSKTIAEQISARSVAIIDARSGQLIWAMDPDIPRQPASTIKVLTGLIAINALKQHDVISVSKKAAEMPRSKIYLEKNRSYSADDLINALLLNSANDASVALAEKIAGSEERFALLMTRYAKKWGARNTICHTASGLTAEGQQTTARDLSTIFRYAMANKDFARRMGLRSGSTRCGKALTNHNKALWRIDGAVAGKTGFTNLARQTYVGQFSRNEQTIIIALMGSESMWADLKKLVDHGFNEGAINAGQLARQRQVQH